MLKICSNLFEAWNKNNIRYCHWKSNEHLKEGLEGLTDLDIYVCEMDKKNAEILLSKFECIKFVPQKGARYSHVDEWMGFDYETGKLIHIHLHYQIITGTKFNKEYVLPVDELMIDSRVKDEETGVFVASPNLEIIVLYCRIALKAKDKKNIKVNEAYQKEIAFLRNRIDYGVLRKYCMDLFGELGTVLFNMIEKETLDKKEWYEVYTLAETWLKKYRKYGKIFVKCRYEYYRWKNAANDILNRKFYKCNIIRKTLPKRGIAICFLGSDGSGKSTMSIAIQNWLNWKIDATRFYLGSGDHYRSLNKKILQKVKSFGSSSNLKKNRNGMDDNTDGIVQRNLKDKNESISVKRKILRLCYAILQSTYLKQTVGHTLAELKKAQKYIDKGAVALYDRFPQIQFAGLYDGPKIGIRFSQYNNFYIRWMAAKEEKLLLKCQEYQPDIMFKLYLSPEEAIRRKPDHTIEEIRPKAEITKKLIFKSTKVYDIDASQSYEDELLEIKRIIWKELLRNDSRV